MFDIVICAYNNLELTKRCVESVRKCTETGRFTLFFVNDGSTDDTCKWTYSVPDLYTINRTDNRGYVHSAIQGVDFAMRMSYNPFIFILNNDVELLSWWTTGAVELLADEKVGIIGAYGHKEINNDIVQFISGSRMIIKKEVINQIGFYDPSFRYGYYEDVDLSWRAQKAGWKIKKYSYFEESSSHASGSTFRHRTDRSECREHNKRLLEEKVREYAKHQHSGLLECQTSKGIPYPSYPFSKTAVS